MFRITPVAATENAIEGYPDISPDGRWIAYCSNREGQGQVYIRSLLGSGEKKVSKDGGLSPLWARNGKQLFYWSLDHGKIWVVDIQTGADLIVGNPRLLFENNGIMVNPIRRGFDISLDDQLFLAVRQEDRQPQPVTEINLVLNWFEELKRLAPTKK